ncbi:MAG: type III-A CRISPR-associated RAMP protein Csm5 [Synergistota bacterium]|nr:type III-A CRISPR-associated RAMP protein Csm5 [Synergistota bacterium]
MNLPLKLKKYHCAIEALSPLHIGTGRLNPACRYVLPPDGKHLGCCLRESWAARFLRDGSVTPEQYMRKPSPWSRLPGDEDERKKAVAYTLDYTKAGKKLDKEARPFVRNGFGEAYIPGSSIKGMLRTSLVFSMLVNDEKRKADWQKQFAAVLDMMKHSNRENITSIRRKDSARISTIESVFRKRERPDPKNDIMRAVKIGDTTPADKPLVLSAANVFTSRGDQLQPLGHNTPAAFCELAEPETRFEFDMTIDESLLESGVLGLDRGVRFRNHIDILLGLQDHARVMTQFEKAFLRAHNAFDRVWDKSYESEFDDAVVVRIGWGSGWMGASLFPILAYDPEDDTPQRPLSRKMVANSKGDPQMLLGWALLKIQPA